LNISVNAGVGFTTSARAGVTALCPYEGIVGIPAVAMAAEMVTTKKERMARLPFSTLDTPENNKQLK
jgi:hypothetical protein